MTTEKFTGAAATWRFIETSLLVHLSSTAYGIGFVLCGGDWPDKSGQLPYSPLSGQRASCSRVTRRSSERFAPASFSIRLEIIVSALI